MIRQRDALIGEPDEKDADKTDAGQERGIAAAGEH